MHTEALFTCSMEKTDAVRATDWEPFRVIRHFIDGESDVLSEGCYYACRSSIDRYYRYLNNQDALYRVYWIDETRFEVHENRFSNCA
ncbi:hypothetical protein [Ketobacter sp.]|uniref:hypothetical protein n=1 Tax=Ketobacter sp. TaxID=2083498 RepID=UPI000F29FAFD|nr:hypothetical protein [Ketobacter sp.]MEE2729598.1 hypothetical protein [Pseudomonadota bacterium]RLT94772.1 MAG: hypothetical protein D9N14_15895 [Ketobacter sp.]